MRANIYLKMDIGAIQERERALSARTVSELRDILAAIAAKYSAHVQEIRTEFATACPARATACIHAITDPQTGRTIYPRGAWDPCPNCACMLEQVESWSAKLQRWAARGKWPGSESAPDNEALETIMMTSDDLIKQIQRAESTLGGAIRGVRAQVATLARVHARKNADPLARVRAFIATHWSLLVAILVVIVIIIAVAVFVAHAARQKSIVADQGREATSL